MAGALFPNPWPSNIYASTSVSYASPAITYTSPSIGYVTLSCSYASLWISYASPSIAPPHSHLAPLTFTYTSNSQLSTPHPHLPTLLLYTQTCLRLTFIQAFPSLSCPPQNRGDKLRLGLELDKKKVFLFLFSMDSTRLLPQRGALCVRQLHFRHAWPLTRIPPYQTQNHSTISYE